MAALRKGFIDTGKIAPVLPALALADFSLKSRTGFKGSGAASWLAAQGLVLPDDPNQACTDAQGRMVARLSWGEFLLLGDFAGLEKAWSYESAPMCFPLPRQDSHAWIVVSGEVAPKMMAKICGIDLRPQVFPKGAIAQTSVARLNAIIIADQIGGRGGFHLLSDGSTSQYLWDCLVDAMLEFEGAPVRSEALSKETHGQTDAQG
ncbi:MAG: sarcosine oxidase [Rhodospirillales bacterium]|jgi:sarcosine oxidase subunit gamma|nr:sarcosine oxidase [Rhodospirillales bacterium]